MLRGVLLLALVAGVSATELHVAVAGSDTGDGSAGRPFATLERARDALRALQAGPGLPAGGVTVWLHGGEYERAQPFELGPADSGTADKPIAYRAVPGERVRLSGGRRLPATAFGPVTDPVVVARLDPAAREKVVVADLRALGITEYGQMRARGFRRPYVNPGLELFCGDQALTLARWPNTGTTPIGKVLDKGSVPRNGDFANRGGRFAWSSARPARWLQADDVWLSGLFNYGYADDTIKVAAIDAAERTITMAQATMYGIANGRAWQAYFALNLLEELDTPGEWYLDRRAGRLYVWPPVPLAQARFDVSLLDAPLVCAEGVSWVTLRDLTLELGRGLGVYIERGAHVTLAGCTLRNLGSVGVCIGQGVAPDPIYRHELPDGKPCSRQLGSWHEAIYANTALDRQAGTDHAVLGCDLYNLGAGGVSLGGGDRKALTPVRNVVANCHLHHFNRLDRSYKAAVNVDGVGNIVRGNLIHDAPNNAVYIHGNDHLVELNEIHDTCTVADDMGSIYLGRDPSEQGIVIRHNYLHHNGSSHGATCVLYFDDGSCGVQVVGNLLVANRGNPVWINGGYGHRFEGNLLVGEHGLRIPSGWDAKRFAGWVREPYMQQRLRRAVDITQPPYTTRYPWLVGVLEPADKLVRGSDVIGNVAWRTSGALDTAGNRNRDNLLLTDDPGFIDAAQGDYRLRPDAPLRAKLPAFAPIPFERIGLQRDEFRRALPLRRPTIGTTDPTQRSAVLGTRDADVALVYTLDGSEPDARSTPYAGPIAITKATTLKVRAVSRDGTLASEVVTRELVPVIPSDPFRATPDGWLRAPQAKLHGVEVSPEGDLGHIENGDWIAFGPFEFVAGAITGLELLVANDPKYAGGRLKLRLDSPTGADLATHVFKSTGGFREFAALTIPLTGLDGVHTVYLVFEGGSGIANVRGVRFVRGGR